MGKVGPDDATLLFGTRDSVPWSIVPRCPRVLHVLPTMSDSCQVFHLSQSQLSDIVGSTCNTLAGTAWNKVPWGHCPLCQGAKLHRMDRPLDMVFSTQYKETSYPSLWIRFSVSLSSWEEVNSYLPEFCFSSIFEI